MNKKIAYTLSEILIVLIIIGTLAVIMMRSMNTDAINQDTLVAKASKIVDVFNQASQRILAEEPEIVPDGTFIVNVLGTQYDHGICAKITSGASAGQCNATPDKTTVLNLFSKYIKFSSTGTYCACTNRNASGECTSASCNSSPGTNEVFAQLPGGMNIRIVINPSVTTCPNYYKPGDTTIQQVRANSKNIMPHCWGVLHVDVNGKDGPNTLGIDEYIFGLGESGISSQL